MSYEYFAPLDSRLIQLEILTRLPAVQAVTEALAVTDREVLLGWRDVPRRAEWPEDITIGEQSTGLLISFHTGTLAAREQFLETMANVIAETANQNVRFEEV